MTVLYMPEGKNILATDCEAIVIPTNCRGVQGAGLAKLAATRWPAWSKDYRRGCARSQPSPGVTLGAWLTLATTGPREVLAFTTKDHWRDPSRIKWIASGLDALQAIVIARIIPSIAIPALGCGVRTGQLAWSDVRPLILATAERLSARGVRVEVYPPHEAS